MGNIATSTSIFKGFFYSVGHKDINSACSVFAKWI